MNKYQARKLPAETLPTKECLAAFWVSVWIGFPKGWKACHPKHFPMPLPWSELMRPGLYLKAPFSSIVCLSQGVGGKREKLWGLGLCTLASTKCALINTRVRNCGLRVYGRVNANYVFFFSCILPQARTQAAKSKYGLGNFFLLFFCKGPCMFKSFIWHSDGHRVNEIN